MTLENEIKELKEAITNATRLFAEYASKDGIIGDKKPKKINDCKKGLEGEVIMLNYLYQGEFEECLIEEYKEIASEEAIELFREKCKTPEKYVSLWA